jgi:hypothetical protein
MKLRPLAIASSLILMAVATSGFAQAAGRGTHGHHHAAPRVSVGVGVGFGSGFFDPFYDPSYYDYWYPSYPAYGYVPQPAVPCTPADVPKQPPTNNQFSPDFAYDRIDAARCTPEAVASAAPMVQAPPAAGAQQPPAYYFCRSTNAYYPNVKECAEGWQQFAPKPPGT